MTRFAGLHLHLSLLLPLLPLLACGDGTLITDPGATASGTSTGTSTGTSSGTSTGTGTSTDTNPTTSANGSSSTSSGSDSDVTGTSTDASDTSTGGTSSSSDTTVGVDESSSSSSSGDGSTSSGDGSSSTSTSTGSTTDTTGDETGGDPVMPAGICIGNDLTSFVEPMPQAEELHIVSVYQGTGNAITVTITRTGIPLTLVLSSYESVGFTLVLAPGVLLDQVILNGYESHTVQGQGLAPVNDLSGQFNYLAACAYHWPDDDGGCDTPGLVANASNLTGLALSSFVACYEGSSFTLD